MSEDKVIYNTQEEWLDKKSRSIGGSEISAILGLNPYMTAIDVYLQKTEGRQIENKVIMRAGVVLEPLVAELFQEQTGYEVKIPERRLYVHPEYDFLIGSPDRIYFNSLEGVLECKTTNIDYDSIPDFWQLQNQWYMGVIGKEIGAVAYLRQNRDFGFVEYDFNAELFEAMCAAAVSFWNNNVLQRRPPEITDANLSEVSKIYKAHVDGLKIKATSETQELVKQYVQVKNIKKIVEAKEEEIKNRIKLVMRDAEALTSEEGALLCTWKKNKDGVYFDAETFKSENPELYAKYLKEKQGARPLLTKDKNIFADLSQDGIERLLKQELLTA